MELIFSLDTINDAAKYFLSHIGDSNVIAFHGKMGAGKTTFIHAICDLLKVKDTVSSPTFSIINEYNTIDGQIVYHMDLYRLKNHEEAINAGVEDCLFSGSLCLVEWPENTPGIFPAKTVRVNIHLMNNEKRRIQW